MAVYNSHNTKQWRELLNAINSGDTSAIATALTNIKTSIDSINTALSSLSAEVDINSTQWTNLINAITNQSLNVDLSNITSSIVSNLSNVTGNTITDAINILNTSLVRKDKVYRFLLGGNVNAGQSFAYATGYVSDDNIYIDDKYIKFRRTGVIRLYVHLTGSPMSQSSQKRLWARLMQDSNVVLNLIQYGDYTSLSTERIMSVSDSTSVSIIGVEGIMLNAGGIGPSFVEIQWIS